MKRYKHNLSHYRLATMEMGRLTPMSCVPVLPGDTFQGNTSALIRVSPLNTPVMHPVQVRVHHFFVPNRIIWPEWEEFITGGDGVTTAPVIPTITQTATKNNMLSYLGVPPIDGVQVNALPLRAVNAIINEWYLDQDLETPRTEEQNTRFRVAWEKDYFTTARPWSQKGPQVTLPLGDKAAVEGIGVVQGQTLPVTNTNVTETGGGADTYVNAAISANIANMMAFEGENSGGDPAIYANLATATATDVNAVRAAFALQRYQEARARYGSRFTEYLRYLGVTPSDARLQRPEFLGGGTTRLNFSEVLQTTPNEASTDGVGDLFGHGIAGVRSNRYRKFFEEHGYVITMLSTRPKAVYMNGVPREFLKTTKEDYFQKELVNLGQQEVFEAEVYGENTREVFGFQDRYHEYRSQPSQVVADFRDTLNAWHLARELAPNPVLNGDFVRCDPSKRIFQIEDPLVDSLWVMANHHLVARRLVPSRANPRIL